MVPTTSIEGTVAVGAAVPGALITVSDADPTTPDVTGTADASGNYAIDVSSQRPPLLVTARGAVHGEPVRVVAVVPTLSAGTDLTVNVTPLTTAIAALVAPAGDVDALASPGTLAAVAAADVGNATALVVNTLRSNPAFDAALGTGFDPLTTPFVADGTGIDAVLDQVQVQVAATGVTITNLTAALDDDSGPPPPAVLTAQQLSDPANAPTLPASVPTTDLPTPVEMLALAKKIEDCLALPLAQRVTLDANNEVTSVSPACSFAPPDWKADGGNWAERVGTNLLRYAHNTGAKVGQPTIAAVFEPPNASGTTFQHPSCNTQRCVVMNVPLVTASGRPLTTFWQLGKLAGQWDYVGNQLPYAMGVEMRLYRYIAVNSALAAQDPSNYYRQDRLEATIRLNFNPAASANANTPNIRAVVWKGPGLPAAGVVTHRSQRCGTEDRFPITNQEGLLTVNNSSQVQFWNNGGGIDFIVDAARPDGAPLALPTPTSNWASTAAPANQNVRSAPFSGSIPAWSTYRAEIYTFANTTATPDEVIVVRNATPFEPAAAGAAKSWPTLPQSYIDQYLKPTGAKTGSLTSLDEAIAWTNPADGYVSWGYLFGQNRVTATNSESETNPYWKRGLMVFRPQTFGDQTVTPAYDWGGIGSGTALSPSTASVGSNPNPRCTTPEIVALDTDATTYREAGLQFRGADRKLYQASYFWTNQ
ncbi:carboxypeptidase-like regulatory domain-containing protein [Calidifontimicrobium sp. SYSU G02091]|uniref:carboxypeptidase-like regulatory domain-containing protein n=1 Tax=Calidifontimicrobium sp. SYSU G02091 TaxID=2926421 RepID=UPI001F53DD4A|nr:carboxypeptidase-like regulatory domain-containing protein [Calidifontimicrobium sp. SYSU G02091]MCI1193094.1 carboxypeptidase-like regulatory domain-containing protein [Calidifontimicrobium sp. SYSU G02091]